MPGRQVSIQLDYNLTNSKLLRTTKLRNLIKIASTIVGCLSLAPDGLESTVKTVSAIVDYPSLVSYNFQIFVKRVSAIVEYLSVA